MLRYRLPDGRSWKRLWVGSFTMLLVLLEHRARSSEIGNNQIQLTELATYEERTPEGFGDHICVLE